MIKRDYYLNKLIRKMNNGLIKVITGIRRCGKSFLLFHIFRDYLLSQGIKKENIISVELDRLSFEKLRDPYKLYEYILNHIKSDVDKINYLKDLFTETYIKDIKERNKIKNDNEFEQLLNIISSSVGSLTNPTKLVNTFKSVCNKSISPNTIKDYLDYLEDSYLIRKSLRYDVKGKKYINTPSKYYFTDIGLRNARLNFRQQEENHIMENIIYNELCIRGFSIDVGVVEINEKQLNGKYIRKQLECDFVINKGSSRYYIQSAYDMPNDEKNYQEKKSLLNIEDSFKKVIIVKDNIKPKKDENGILTIGLKDFLLNDESIDL